MSASVLAARSRLSCRRSPDGAERNPGTAVQLLCRSRVSLRSTRATRKEIRKRNAGRRMSKFPHPSMRRASSGTRTSVGVPPRLSPKGLSSPKAQRQAMLPGTWPERSVLYARPNLGAETLRLSTGVTRAKPVPVQRSTSRAGHSAGRHDAQAARERTVSVRPRAPHPLRPFRSTSRRRPFERDS